MKSVVFFNFLIFCFIETLLLAKEPETVIPARQNEWWMSRHESILEKISKEKDKINFVMIGDSITHFMENRANKLLKETFPSIHSLNLGFSADKTENVLWRLKNGEIKGVNPKLVMIMIGTNNSGHRKDNPKDTAKGIELIVNEVKKQCPQSKILLLSIFPRGETSEDQYHLLNKEVNKIIPLFADNKIVFHLDINKYFLNEQGNLVKKYMPDLLHPSYEGYQVWMTAVKETVEGFLK